jgi:hypothetical protein
MKDTPETNELGNLIFRDGDADAKIGLSRGEDRYRYDFTLDLHAWQQYDTRQDASYFGIWVNVKERKVFSYTEGDRTMVECPTLESFRAELKSMEEFYGPPPPSFIACDWIGVNNGKFVPEGNVEYFFDKRPTADEEEG